MIEVEKKFIPSKKFFDHLQKHADFIRNICHQDTYFDTKDFALTSIRHWLRKRNECFELKVPIKKENYPIDQYREITEEDEIKTFLDLSPELSLKEGLEKKKILPFLSFSTQRKTYRLNNLTIDLDQAFCDDLTYQVAEVEILVEKKDEIPLALTSLRTFFSDFGIEEAQSISTKLDYFLYHKNRAHYQALVDAKAIFPLSEIMRRR